MDLSGQTVVIKLNPAATGTYYDPSTGFLHFVDSSGNGCEITVPKPVQQGTNGWWTCFPLKCEP